MSDAVLVGIDGSEDSLASLRWAGRLAAGTGRRLELAYAWQHGRRLEGVFSTEHSDPSRLEAEVVSTLHEIAGRELGNVAASCRALRGPVATSLRRAAERTGASLIVVGASGSGGARRTLLGSVSRELTSCPSGAVAVVPRDENESAAAVPRVLVAVDGSDGSSRALRWAAHAAQQAGGDIVAVHAFECPVTDPSPREMASLSRERQQRFEQEWCAPLRVVGVPYRGVFEKGDPRRVLRRVAESERPMCVVVGSRGLGPVSQRLLGSVTHYLVRESPSPTVIIPSSRDCPVWPPPPDAEAPNSRRRMLGASTTDD